MTTIGTMEAAPSVLMPLPILKRFLDYAWWAWDIPLVIGVLENPNIPRQWVDRALADAAAWGWTEMVQALLELPERLRPAPGCDGNQPLIQALSWGCWEVVGVLLAYEGPGAIPVMTPQGEPTAQVTSLYWAEANQVGGGEGCVECALEKRGVDIAHPALLDGDDAQWVDDCDTIYSPRYSSDEEED